MKNIINKHIFRVCLLGILSQTASTPAGAQERGLNLNDYLETVTRDNLSYAAERFNVSIAQAEIAAARVMPDPELGFEAEDEVYNLALGYTLEMGGKRRARIRVARTQAEAERLAVEYFFQELRAGAADAFLEALLQQELLRVKRDSYQYMLRLSQSDSIRFRLGEITENEARQSRLETSMLLNEVYEQEAASYMALAELGRYMSRQPDTLLVIGGSLQAPHVGYDLHGLQQAAAEHRADLQGVLKEAQAAVEAIRLERAERVPDLGLAIGYERDWHGFLPARNNLKGGISIPLPFSSINKGSLRVAQLEASRSQKIYEQSVIEVQNEVAQAFFAYEAAGRQVRQFETGMLDQARMILEGIRYKYTRGETDILELLIAQRTYNEVREEYLETLKGHASARIELEKSSGIWEPWF